MSPNEYELAALRTTKTPVTPTVLLTYALGMAGENGEVHDLFTDYNAPVDVDKLKLELGDMLWYTTVLASIHNIYLQDLINMVYGMSPSSAASLGDMTLEEFHYEADLRLSSYNDNMVRDTLLLLTTSVGEVCEWFKKVYGHGHDVSIATLKSALGDVLAYVTQLGILHNDMQLVDIMQGNIEKLKVRFPAGFNTVDSVQRVDTHTLQQPIPGNSYVTKAHDTPIDYVWGTPLPDSRVILYKE